MESIVEISAKMQGDSVVCELPNGGLIEITMVRTEGDEIQSVTTVPDAMKILSKNPHLLRSRD